MNQPSLEVLAVCAKWLDIAIVTSCGEFAWPPASAELEVALIRKLNAEGLMVLFIPYTGEVVIYDYGRGFTIYDAVADMLKRRGK